MEIKTNGIFAWMRRREARRVLMGFDDYQLADIGISRSDIDQAVLGRSGRPR
jgi:uncharacterized protein YjiS (DUF1127 family)